MTQWLYHTIVEALLGCIFKTFFDAKFAKLTICWILRYPAHQPRVVNLQLEEQCSKNCTPIYWWCKTGMAAQNSPRGGVFVNLYLKSGKVSDYHSSSSPNTHKTFILLEKIPTQSDLKVPWPETFLFFQPITCVVNIPGTYVTNFLT